MEENGLGCDPLGCRGVWVVGRDGLVVAKETREPTEWVSRVVQEARELMAAEQSSRILSLAPHEWCHMYRVAWQGFDGVLVIWEDRTEEDTWRLTVQSMAHDINNLLAVVSGHMELWPHRPPSQQEQTRREVEWALEQAVELVAQLNTLATGDEPGHGSANLLEVLQHLGAWVERPNIRLELDYPPTAIPVVDMPRTACVEIFHNLLQNAADAMPDGGIIQISVQVTQDVVMVSVQDSGPGIAKDEEEAIFSPYYSTKARGRGLGLYRVRELVEQYQGSVQLQSVSGVGSCFVVRLPRMREAPP
ncbi:MAG: HAMP domain-containing sensor histidine kinase [Firmicutes bacterium]|nr:HAMP domain-containing sensor histidine kinase [Bacillota bacterium]